jgi:hypothetical protein
MRFRTPAFAAVSMLGSLSPAHAAGPVWTVRDIDQFQDNFASDGTIFGIVRADIGPTTFFPLPVRASSRAISSVVVVADPTFGLPMTTCSAARPSIATCW